MLVSVCMHILAMEFVRSFVQTPPLLPVTGQIVTYPALQVTPVSSEP